MCVNVPCNLLTIKLSFDFLSYDHNEFAFMKIISFVEIPVKVSTQYYQCIFWNIWRYVDIILVM